MTKKIARLNQKSSQIAGTRLEKIIQPLTDKVAEAMFSKEFKKANRFANRAFAILEKGTN